MAHFQYFALLGGCLLLTLSLEFVFEARVYRRIGRLSRAMAAPLAMLWAIDSLALVRHLWTYSRRYTVGLVVPHKLPIEEIAFFVAIPICAILTFEAANAVYHGRVVPPWRRHSHGDRPWVSGDTSRSGRPDRYQGRHVRR